MTSSMPPTKSQRTGLLCMQEFANALDLVMAHESRRVTAALDFDDFRAGIATNHVPREVQWQEIRVHASKHEGRSLDRRPVFPEVNIVVPGVAKGPNNVRV